MACPNIVYFVCAYGKFKVFVSLICQTVQLVPTRSTVKCCAVRGRCIGNLVELWQCSSFALSSRTVSVRQVTKASLCPCARRVCLSLVRLCGLSWGETNGSGKGRGEYRSCRKHTAKWTADSALLQANESAALVRAAQKNANGSEATARHNSQFITFGRGETAWKSPGQVAPKM